jgi:hypothetical protein
MTRSQTAAIQIFLGVNPEKSGFCYNPARRLKSGPCTQALLESDWRSECWFPSRSVLVFVITVTHPLLCRNLVKAESQDLLFKI